MCPAASLFSVEASVLIFFPEMVLCTLKKAFQVYKASLASAFLLLLLALSIQVFYNVIVLLLAGDSEE